MFWKVKAFKSRCSFSKVLASFQKSMLLISKIYTKERIKNQSTRAKSIKWVKGTWKTAYTKISKNVFLIWYSMWIKELLNQPVQCTPNSIDSFEATFPSNFQAYFNSHTFQSIRMYVKQSSITNQSIPPPIPLHSYPKKANTKSDQNLVSSLTNRSYYSNIQISKVIFG